MAKGGTHESLVWGEEDGDAGVDLADGQGDKHLVLLYLDLQAYLGVLIISGGKRIQLHVGQSKSAGEMVMVAIVLLDSLVLEVLVSRSQGDSLQSGLAYVSQPSP